MRADMVVIGAGPVGMMAALLAKARGAADEITVIDKRPNTPHRWQLMTMTNATTPAFHEAGILERIYDGVNGVRLTTPNE